MAGRVRVAAGLAMVVVVGATSAGAGLAGAAPAQAGGTVTVTPATGVVVGDTVTLTGVDLPPQDFGYRVLACTAEAGGLSPDEGVGPFLPYCVTPPHRLQAPDYSVTVTVASADWAYLGAYYAGTTIVRLAPIDVVDPPAPVVDLRLPDPDVGVGERVLVEGSVWPRPQQVSFRLCRSVPADPLDAAAVDAACDPATSRAPAPDGTFAGVDVAFRARAGDVAVWAGAETSAGPVAAVVPMSATPGGPTLDVSQVSDLEVGDTVTVTAAGFPPTVIYGWFLFACPGSVADLPATAVATDFLFQCRDLDPSTQPTDPNGTRQLRIDSPAWEYLVMVDAGTVFGGDVDDTRLVALDVLPVAEPSFQVTVPERVVDGAYPDATGLTVPAAAEATYRYCTALPDKDDPASVDAACETAYTVETEFDGTFAAGHRVRPEYVALWVGAEVGGQQMTALAPITVSPPTVTLTPATDLAPNQVVRVEPDIASQTWPELRTCDGAVLADGRVTREEVAADCGPVVANWPFFATPVVVEHTARGSYVVGPAGARRVVQCTAAPGACALVVTGEVQEDGQFGFRLVGGGAPLVFGAQPPLPLLVPHAAATVEGDSGTTAVQVPVTLSAPAATPVTVRYQTVTGANPGLWVALPGSDYLAAEGSVTFAPGQTTASIPIEVVGDTLRDGQAEMALVALTQPVGAGLGGYGGIGGVIITDDD